MRYVVNDRIYLRYVIRNNYLLVNEMTSKEREKKEERKKRK